MKFQDEYGRWHHNPIKEGEKYSSNNPYIYSAECKVMGLPISSLHIFSCYRLSITTYGFNRHPDKTLPAISHDEAIAVSYLFKDTGFSKQEVKNWEYHHWQVCNLPGFKPKSFLKLNWIKVVKALLEINRLDKLYKKTNGEEGKQARHATVDFPEVHPVAFHMGGWKRYLIKRHAGVKTTLYEKISFLTSKLFTIYLGKINSSKRLLGFQLLMIENKSIIEKLLSVLFNRRHDLKEIAAGEYHSKHPILSKL
jgi:hypothetical protein